MTEDLVIFDEATRKFMEREAAPHADKWTAQKHVDRAIWTKAGEMGLL
ncbi:MAG TPA: acyl-CoA dehydrogenase, partial [Alphaproteobacteria bacterium]|nr:acyl-CoA dehydrogenase [Alphaproteobacteria bacterium]